MAKGKSDPLALKVDDLRISFDVSVLHVSKILGITKATYYNWMGGSCAPTKRHRRGLIDVAKAIVRASEAGDLPVPRRIGMSMIDHRQKVLDTIVGYMGFR